MPTVKPRPYAPWTRHQPTTRFGLGIIQFVRAVENLGRALYEYGAEAKNTNVPFLRLPVPKNDKPSAISYRALGRVLDAFAADLGRAEATLAGIRDDNVALRLRLAKVSFDFTGTEVDRATLVQVLDRLNGGRFEFLKKNPEFEVRFDRGDAAWLRGYCHLLSAMVNGYRAVDEEVGFEDQVRGIFPKVEPGAKKFDEQDPAGEAADRLDRGAHVRVAGRVPVAHQGSRGERDVVGGIHQVGHDPLMLNRLEPKYTDPAFQYREITRTPLMGQSCSVESLGRVAGSNVA